RSRGTDRARVLQKALSLKSKRAQGMPGRQPHPQPCVRMEEAHKQSHHRSAAFAGIPCAMVYDLFRVLPGETGLCCHRRLSEDSGGLAPASGRQDHTASPSANECRSSCDTIRVHRIPPRVRDDASAPHTESGWQQVSTISEKKKEKFCKKYEKPMELASRVFRARSKARSKSQLHHHIVAFDSDGNRFRDIRPLHHRRARLDIDRIGLRPKAAGIAIGLSCANIELPAMPRAADDLAESRVFDLAGIFGLREPDQRALTESRALMRAAIQQPEKFALDVENRD